MIPIIEFQNRSLHGPVMKADEFDLEFSMKLRELVAKYGIKYNPEELIVDDATADAVFQAGVELLAGIGLYHLETERVIKFTKEEVETIAREYRESPSKHTFGKGKDEVTIEYRTGTDACPPTLYAGAAGVAEEEWFGAFIQSFAQEESLKALGICPGLAKLGNIEPKAGTPSEIYVAQWEQKKIKETLDRVGRPDMHCGLLATVSTIGGTMAMIGPGLREAHNTQIGVHIIPEQKLDWARLILSQFCQDRGIQPWQSSMSMIGGLCRDAADTAVSMVANLLGQLSYAKGSLCSFFTNHMDGNWGTPACLWAYNAAARASERNIRVCIGGVAAPAMGFWYTEAQLVHATVIAILNSASGMSYLWIGGATGIDARLIGEAMNVTAGMEPQKANKLIKDILAKVDEYEPKEWITAVPFSDMYDIVTIKPKPEYETMLMKAKDELARLGVPYH
ncbi:MAG: monomethylamine:corrinoid methyltransferase [Chloroflexi bacterium]|jgi:methylamine---corrinoid protein Co-methyltransferase|nr:monomethylamine:corrinoid methyltransferase [Chloroflexota bacterium]